MFVAVSCQVPNVPEATFISTLSVDAPNQAVFPVVNRAGAVGRQVSKPAAAHHALQDLRRAVAQQMCAVNQHHGRVALARGANLPRTFDDPGSILGCRRLGRRIGVDEDFLDPGQVVPLAQREHLQSAQVQRFDIHRWMLVSGNRMSSSCQIIVICRPRHSRGPRGHWYRQPVYNTLAGMSLPDECRMNLQRRCDTALLVKRPLPCECQTAMPGLMIDLRNCRRYAVSALVAVTLASAAVAAEPGTVAALITKAPAAVASAALDGPLSPDDAAKAFVLGAGIAHRASGGRAADR